MWYLLLEHVAFGKGDIMRYLFIAMLVILIISETKSQESQPAPALAYMQRLQEVKQSGEIMVHKVVEIYRSDAEDSSIDWYLAEIDIKPLLELCMLVQSWTKVAFYHPDGYILWGIVEKPLGIIWVYDAEYDMFMQILLDADGRPKGVLLFRGNFLGDKASIANFERRRSFLLCAEKNIALTETLGVILQE